MNLADIGVSTMPELVFEGEQLQKLKDELTALFGPLDLLLKAKRIRLSHRETGGYDWNYE